MALPLSCPLNLKFVNCAKPKAAAGGNHKLRASILSSVLPTLRIAVIDGRPENVGSDVTLTLSAGDEACALSKARDGCSAGGGVADGGVD